MLTIRVDALSLEFIRSKPDSTDLLEALLDEDSFNAVEEIPTYVTFKVIDPEIKRLTGASLGEILELVKLLDEYESAITYDCLVVGMRLHQLGTQAFKWGELLAIVQCSPRFSALHRAQNPEWMWDETNHLLAAIGDALHVANWQRGGDKNAKKPKPIKRPGIKEEVTKYGKGAIPYDEMADFLGEAFADFK